MSKRIFVAIAIPNYYAYGFGNVWVSASLVVWLAAGSLSKILKLPVYKLISSSQANDTVSIDKMRHQLNGVNGLQAVLYTVAVMVLAIGLL
jgi:hypothetical protein